MQMINSFGKTLKQLKSISGLKAVMLANYLGYDVSYISKWCADKKLPSGRNIVKIIEDVSRIFSKEIINGGKLNYFNSTYGTDIQDIKELSEYIKILLEDSYDRSRRSVNTSKKDENKIVFGRNEIVSIIKDRVKQISDNYNGKLDIYTTLDILQLDKAYHDKEYYSSCNFPNMNIKIGCDMAMQKEDNFQRLTNMYYLLGKMVNCNVQIYDDKRFSKANVFLVKNEFAMLLSLDEDGEIDFGVVINDKEELDKMYSSVSSKFNSADILIDTIDEEEILEKKYLVNFYNSDKFNFLFNSDFDYLKPEVLIKDLDKVYLEEKRISYLQNIVDKKMKSSDMNIFVNHKMMNDYMYSTLIESGEDELRNVFERLDYLVDSMEENDGIKVYSIDCEKLDMETIKSCLSVYSSEQFIILKRKKDLNRKKISFYIIKNPQIITCIENAYKALLEKNNVKKINKSEFIENINRCKKTFNNF